MSEVTETSPLSADAIRYLDYLRQIERRSLAAESVFADFLEACAGADDLREGEVGVVRVLRGVVP